MKQMVLEYIACQQITPRTRRELLHYLGLLRSELERWNRAITDPARDLAPFVMTILASLKPHAKKRCWTVYSRFFTWLILEGRNQASPMSRIPKPKAHTRPKMGLPQGDLLKLVDQLDADCSNHDAVKRYGALRLRLIVTLDLYYGLRPGEVLGLLLKDWHQEDKLLIVNRKGGDQITIQIDALVNELIFTWCLARKSRAPRDEPAIFTDWRGHALKEAALRSQLKKLASRAGVELPCGGLHQLRHTMAGIMVKRGDSIQEVARYLGHKRLSSTDYYLHQHFGEKNGVGAEIIRGLRAQLDDDQVITFPGVKLVGGDGGTE